MTWKKTWFSYLLWAVFSTVFGIYFGLAVYAATGLLRVEESYIRAGIVCLSYIAVAGIFIAIRTAAAKNIGFHKNPYLVTVMEGTAVIVILALGLLLRILNLERGVQESGYFEAAKVAQNNPIIPLAHGVQYIYVLMLRFLFSVVGNQWTAGIVLQIVLQITAAGVLFVGVKKLAGTLPSLMMLGGIMFLTSSVEQGLSYSPNMLYLCLYAIGILWSACFLERREEGKITRWYHLINLFGLGIYIALLTYLDILGLTLVCLVISAAWLKTEDKLLAAELFTVFLGFMAGVAGTVWIDALSNDISFFSVLNVWMFLFEPKINTPIKQLVSDMKRLPAANIGWWLTGIGGMLAMIPGFFTRRKEENSGVWILLFMMITAMTILGIPAKSMGYGYILTVLFWILAGVGIRQLIYPQVGTAAGEENGKENLKLANKIENVIVQESAPVWSEEPAAAWEEELVELEADKPVKYIENPLPLPKKHQKKTMTYGIEVSPDKMSYDIDVPEQDDFDI